jgi:hypothetical protein
MVDASILSGYQIQDAMRGVIHCMKTFEMRME